MTFRSTGSQSLDMLNAARAGRNGDYLNKPTVSDGTLVNLSYDSAASSVRVNASSGGIDFGWPGVAFGLAGLLAAQAYFLGLWIYNPIRARVFGLGVDQGLSLQLPIHFSSFYVGYAASFIAISAGFSLIPRVRWLWMLVVMTPPGLTWLADVDQRSWISLLFLLPIFTTTTFALWGVAGFELRWPRKRV